MLTFTDVKETKRTEHLDALRLMRSSELSALAGVLIENEMYAGEDGLPLVPDEKIPFAIVDLNVYLVNILTSGEVGEMLKTRVHEVIEKYGEYAGEEE